MGETMADIRRIGAVTDELGEGPVWCPRERALYWVDIRGQWLRRWVERGDQVTSWPMPEQIGSLAIAEQGGILVALRSGMAVFDPMTAGFQKLADFPGHGRTLRSNDGKCDRQGRFWVGTMERDTIAPTGKLYRLAGGVITTMIDGVRIPNSLCWSPDGATMYWADSLERVIWAFPFDPGTGAIGERRVFTEIDPSEVPDGATVDSDGYLWSARYGGSRVVRHAPDGKVDRVIALPARQITSCAFGGSNLSTLFITSATQNMDAAQRTAEPQAGHLFAVDVGLKGLREPRYKG
jgi:sugar lactone lactonase YvrE